MLEFSRSNNGIPLAFYNDHLMRISISGEAAKKFYDYLKQAIPQFEDKIHLHKPIHMVLLICENGEQIYHDFFPELTFIRNTSYCVDIFNTRGSKAFGITKCQFV